MIDQSLEANHIIAKPARTWSPCRMRGPIFRSPFMVKCCLFTLYSLLIRMMIQRIDDFEGTEGEYITNLERCVIRCRQQHVDNRRDLVPQSAQQSGTKRGIEFIRFAPQQPPNKPRQNLSSSQPSCSHKQIESCSRILTARNPKCRRMDAKIERAGNLARRCSIVPPQAFTANDRVSHIYRHGLHLRLRYQ